MRNPPWEYDEIILALDLYLTGRKVLEEHHPAVVDLSRVLNALPLHPERGSGNFRSPDAVVLKLANLRSHDPETASAGMNAGARRTRDVWERFADQPDEVRRLAAAIRSIAPTLEATSQPDEDGALEGRLLMRRHRLRERDPRVVRRRRNQFIAAHGRLFCEACDLDPIAMYGARGPAVIECHHTRPLSDGGERRTRLEDLMLLCANCHRVVHRATPWLDADALRALVRTPHEAGPATTVLVAE